jgi:small subunit ribosomal protein S25
MHSHFLKEDLPRIRYANPKIDIQVNKLVKIKDETWQPELVLEFCLSSFPAEQLCIGPYISFHTADGRKQSIDIHNKWSSTIFQELMDTAGGNSWTRWKTERAEAGLPVVDGPTGNYTPPSPRPKTGAAAVLP